MLKLVVFQIHFRLELTFYMLRYVYNYNYYNLSICGINFFSCRIHYLVGLTKRPDL